MHLFTPVERELWLAVARACPHATFFHTPYWQDLALGTFTHCSDASIGALLPGGVRAVLPLICVGERGPLRDLCSTFELYYGGLIADGPVRPADAARIYAAARGWRTRRLWLTGAPLADLDALPGGFEQATDFTQVIPLQGSFEETFARLPEDRRATYRRAQRKGVRVRTAASLEDIAAYYALYEDGLRRWAERGIALIGRPYSLEQFERCFDLAQRHPEVARLWLAEVEGAIAAGAWIFTWNRHAISWQASTSAAHQSYHPASLLHGEIIRDAVARGVAQYDLGPSGGVAGVVAFKEAWGAERRTLTRAHYTAPAVTLLSAIRDRARPLVARLQAQREGA